MNVKFEPNFWRLAILILLALPGAAQTVTIYNNFLPGKTYECCGGQWAAGSAAAPTAGLAGTALAAGTFTPSGTFNLTQIDIALTFDYGALGSPSGAVTLSLNQDAAGVPGAVIETWTGIVVPPQMGGTSSLIQTVHPVSTVPLLAGHPYWIIASPALPNSLLLWNVNNVEGKGAPGTMAYNYGFGWFVTNFPNAGLAFDVEGTPTDQWFTDALRIPQIVDGGGWKTRFVITNTDQVPVTFNFQFWGQDGSALPFPVLNGTAGTLSGTLTPGGSFFAESPGTSSTLRQGWAEIASSGKIGVRAIYQFSVGGSRDSLGTEVAAASTTSVSMPFDNTLGNATAIAVANTNPTQPLTVSMLFVTDGGVQSTVSLLLQPHTQQTFVSAAMHPAIADARGLLTLTTATADMAVVGLEFTAAGQFTWAGAF
jgi:hypothetical protein